MASVKNSVWYGELERFGCTLTVVGETEKEVKDALMSAYEKTYRDYNNDADPREEIDINRYYRDEMSYYDRAVEDISVWEMLFGKVEWR